MGACGSHRFLGRSILCPCPAPRPRPSRQDLALAILWCSRSTQTEGLNGYMIARLTQGFSIRCLRFTSGAAAAHAELASGWRAAPLPGGGRTPWIASKGFRRHLHSPFPTLLSQGLDTPTHRRRKSVASRGPMPCAARCCPSATLAGLMARYRLTNYSLPGGKRLGLSSRP